MWDAGSTPSVAIAQRTPTTWRIRGRRSRKKRPHADPTVSSAIRRDVPAEAAVREYLAEFVRANRRLGIGLFTAKLLDSRRPPKSISERVRQEFGIDCADADLVAAAGDAETSLRQQLRQHFGVAPDWHWRWLPRIESV